MRPWKKSDLTIAWISGKTIFLAVIYHSSILSNGLSDFSISSFQDYHLPWNSWQVFTDHVQIKSTVCAQWDIQIFKNCCFWGTAVCLHMSCRTGTFGNHQPCCTCRKGPGQSGPDSLCSSNKVQGPDSQSEFYRRVKMIRFYENVIFLGEFHHICLL